MRVISGSAKGRELRGPKAAKGHIRPTSDRVREALFDMLRERVDGARVLDLYAGTGALGIEALSRGAQHLDLVEADREAQRLIRENLTRTGLSDRAELQPRRVEQALSQLAGQYDVILADPPYADASVVGLLPAIEPLLQPSGTLVLEHASRAAMPDEPGGLRLWKRRRHGDTTLSLYRHAEPAE
jgi:16S rRNA (guanine(966)-N(2))-methyltransferase RsmD